MNTSIAMLALFVIRLAIPFVILFVAGEWLSRREHAAPLSRNS